MEFDKAANKGDTILGGKLSHVTKEFSRMNAGTMDRILAAIGY